LLLWYCVFANMMFFGFWQVSITSRTTPTSGSLSLPIWTLRFHGSIQNSRGGGRWL
jgi:hypothetical protein